MGQRNCKRHKLRGFIAGKAKHHSLVARAGLVVFIRRAVLCLVRLVHPHGNVRRLHVNGGQNTAGIAVKPIFGVVITYPLNDIPYNSRNIHIAFCGYLAHHVDDARCCSYLAGYMRLWILRNNLVQNSIGDLVA